MICTQAVRVPTPLGFINRQKVLSIGNRIFQFNFHILSNLFLAYIYFQSQFWTILCMLSNVLWTYLRMIQVLFWAHCAVYKLFIIIQTDNECVCNSIIKKGHIVIIYHWPDIYKLYSSHNNLWSSEIVPQWSLYGILQSIMQNTAR